MSYTVINYHRAIFTPPSTHVVFFLLLDVTMLSLA